MRWPADPRTRLALLLAAVLAFVGAVVYVERSMDRGLLRTPSGSIFAGSSSSSPGSPASAPGNPSQQWSTHGLATGGGPPTVFHGRWVLPRTGEGAKGDRLPVAQGELGEEGGGGPVEGGGTQPENEEAGGQKEQVRRLPAGPMQPAGFGNTERAQTGGQSYGFPQASGGPGSAPSGRDTSAAATQGVSATRLAPVPLPGPKVREVSATPYVPGAYRASAAAPPRLNSSDAGAEPIKLDRAASFAIQDETVQKGEDNGINAANQGNASGENSIKPR